MKHPLNFILKTLVLVFSGCFLSGISAYAYNNLSTSGGTSTGGSGATPSLSQVTAVGATTNNAVTLNGGLTSGNMFTVTDNTYDIGASSTRWRSIYATSTFMSTGTQALPSYSWAQDVDTGIWNFTPNGVAIGGGNTTYARFQSGLITLNNEVDPLVTATNDLGDPTLSWNNFYASGTANIGGSVFSAGTATNTFAGPVSSTKFAAGTGVNNGYTFQQDGTTGFILAAGGNYQIKAGGTVVLSGTAAVANWVVSHQFVPTNTFDMGSQSFSLRHLYASGTAMLGGSVFTRDHIPYINNASDIGSVTSSWRNIYASGTAALANVTSTAVTSSFMYITNAPAAGTGLNPFCSGTGGQVTVGSAGVCPVSALDMKNNVRPAQYGLNELMKTRFYDFELKNDANRVRTGVVADYSDKVMPEYTIKDEKGKIIGVDTNSLVGVIGRALQQLVAKFTGLEDRLNQQQREIDELKLLIDSK